MKSFATVALIICATSIFGLPASFNDNGRNDCIVGVSQFAKHNRANAVYDDPSIIGAAIECLDAEKTISANYANFRFSSEAEITSIVCETFNQLASWNYVENEIVCNLSNIIANGKTTLDFYSSGVLIGSYALYFAENTSGIIYSSGLSLDEAKRNAGISLNYDLIDETEEEAEDSIHHPVHSQAPSTSGSITGTFQWQDDQGLTHPLVGARVKLRIVGSGWDSTAYADQNGDYSFEYIGVKYNGSGKPKVTLYADDGGTINVKKSGTYAKTHEFETIGGNNSYSYVFSPTNDGDMGKAIMIFQAAKLYSDHIKELNNNNAITKCSFVYPSNKSKCKYYNNVVYITGTPPKKSFPNSYASWDMIGHEYAHHIQEQFDIANSPGGTHTIGTNLIDQLCKTNALTQAKNKALRLSWGEGWATYWSIVAQQSFPDEFKTIRTVGNTDYSAYNGVDYKLDVYIDRSNGEASELAVQKTLFKLYFAKTDEYDRFALGEETLWDIVVEKKPTTLCEFIQDLYDDGYDKHELGKLLGQFSITPLYLEIKNDYLDRCPTFSWPTDSGSTNLPYDSFDLVFTTPSGVEFMRRAVTTSNPKTATYTLTRDEWSTVISARGTKYGVYLIARQTHSPSTGDYYSELFWFDEPDDFADKVQIKPNEWGFKPQYFFETNKENQTSTPITDHGLTITHDRLRCGYIENSYVILSPRRQGAGRAYFTMDFSQAVYSYMFGITLWSDSEYLSTNDSTAVVEWKDQNGVWHEDMDLLSDPPNGLSTRDQQVDRYQFAHTEGIYGLRFVATSSAIGDRNKGRLCLDDIVLNTNANDLWFISKFYQ